MTRFYYNSTKLYVILTLLTIQLCNGFAFSQSLNTLVIDPGHGGKDHGCTGDHSIEKHLTLDMAYKVQRLIQKQDPSITIHLTRTHDVFVPLEERCAYANKLDADLFISIHCNQIDIKSVNGTETYVLGDNVDHQAANTLKREQSTYTLDRSNDYDGNLDYILAQSLHHQNLKESIFLASLVMDAFAKTTDLKRRTIKQANFRVLSGLYMPGILVETGFISNHRDERYLLSNAGQYAVANALMDAVTQYRDYTSESIAVHEVTPHLATTAHTHTPKPHATRAPIVSYQRRSTVTYGVLIAKTVNTTANTQRAEWTQLPHYDIYQDDQSYHYIVGDYAQKNMALQKLVELREIGFRGASVIPLDVIKSFDKVN